MGGEYEIEIAPTAFRSLERIRDKKTLREIGSVIDGLSEDPEAQGSELQRPLEGMRSLRAARDRYRVIYRVDRKRTMVLILLVGPRRAGEREDVYEVAQRLLDVLRGREEELGRPPGE